MFPTTRLHVPLGDTRETLSAIKSLRKSVDSVRHLLGPDAEIYPLSADYVYFEQFINARRDHLVRIGSAVLAIAFVVFCFMNIWTAVTVVFAMLSISVMTFAALYTLGLNAISSILLVSVIGLADEYVCHVGDVATCRNKRHHHVASTYPSYLLHINNIPSWYW